jgi:hypothetical protein
MSIAEACARRGGQSFNDPGCIELGRVGIEEVAYMGIEQPSITSCEEECGILDWVWYV